MALKGFEREKPQAKELITEFKPESRVLEKQCGSKKLCPGFNMIRS